MENSFLKKILITFLCIGMSLHVSANHFLELPPFFSSHMVLQRETPLKFWGWGATGDWVKVEFQRQNLVFRDSAQIDQNGRWLLNLPAQPIMVEPCMLKFSLKDYPTIAQQFENILVGDVWFAAGQSNMEKKVNHLLEANQYISEANNYPLIRAFKTSYNAKEQPEEKLNKSVTPWFACNSNLVADNVSAVAYVFAREVFEQTGIPIGIMQSYRGGNEIETWISPWKFAEPEYCKVAGRKDYLEPLNTLNSHSIHFNGQVNPLKGFPIKGFVWYQGESNTKRAKEYRYMMKMLIEDWRALWGQGDLPFYYVQMFNNSSPATYEEYNWVDIREQQEYLLYDKSVTNRGMAVIIDTNEEATNSDVNIRMHPRNKKPVGIRLAKNALKNTYGKDILAESPVVNRYQFSNDTVFLYYRNYGEGLKLKSGETELKGYIICGADKKFKTARSVFINDSTVAVTSDLVTNPVSVRYAWARNPICNLYNSADFPAMPFRTDMWDSPVSYSTFQTSCNTSDKDASLISIRLNGVSLKNFEPSQFTYTYTTQYSGVYPSVLAITASPWAKVEVLEQKSLSKITITVTAENGTKQVYEIHVNSVSSVSTNTMAQPIKIMQGAGSAIIQNESNEKLDVSITSSDGRCVFNEQLLQNEQKQFKGAAGIYILNVFFLGFSRKVMIK
ncbi:MAG: sialate O-acetylesterase [Paludibacter sp.]|nr:sialate O-acetylesterase [Paludibacter sp.]